MASSTFPQQDGLFRRGPLWGASFDLCYPHGDRCDSTDYVPVRWIANVADLPSGLRTRNQNQLLPIEFTPTARRNRFRARRNRWGDRIRSVNYLASPCSVVQRSRQTTRGG